MLKKWSLFYGVPSNRVGSQNTNHSYLFKRLVMNLINRILPLLLVPVIVVACQGELQQPSHMFSINNPAETGSRFPNLHTDASGNVFMSWVSNIEEDIYAIEYAVFDGERWSESRTVKLSNNFFVNWADFPSVVGKNGEAVASHWLRKVEGGPYAYHVKVAFAEKESNRWKPEFNAHLDDSPTEHGFVTLEPIDEDRILAIWLDGRETDGRGHGEYEDFDKSMTLRSAEISSDGEITRKRVIDDTVCDCCQTDLVPVEDGFIAVYRDRSEDEIRDISFARYSNETGEWSEPQTIHDDGWKMMACPVNGPRVTSDGNRVAVTWFTGADDQRKVKLAFSYDGGESFSEPKIVADEYAVGRADVAFGNNDDMYVSWMAEVEDDGYIMLRRITSEGGMDEPYRVGLTASSRQSGFPRMEKTGNHLLFAWTQTEPLMRVRTAKVEIDENQ